MSIDSIFIVGFIVLGVYKIIELLVRRKERLTFIEKLVVLYEDKKIADSLHLPNISFGNGQSGSWALRISLLLIGVGIGCLLSFFTMYHLSGNTSVHGGMREFLTFSFISIFGGIGLLTAYLIESKQDKH
jgi:hypothetical protein